MAKLVHRKYVCVWVGKYRRVDQKNLENEKESFLDHSTSNIQKESRLSQESSALFYLSKLITSAVHEISSQQLVARDVPSLGAHSMFDIASPDIF